MYMYRTEGFGVEEKRWGPNSRTLLVNLGLERATRAPPKSPKKRPISTSPNFDFGQFRLLPALKKQISTRRPPERKKKENCSGRGEKKKARNFGQSSGGRSGEGGPGEDKRKKTEKKKKRGKRRKRKKRRWKRKTKRRNKNTI